LDDVRLGKRAEAILLACADVIELLGRAPSWREVAPDVLRLLGEAAQVDRTYVFENSVRDDGELLQDETYEWTAPGVSTTIEDPENHGWPYSQGQELYRQALGSGKPLYGPITAFPDEERNDLLAEGILSLAMVPVFVDEEWWGFIGFDDCKTPRAWSDVEVAALRAGAAAMASAIYRERLRTGAS
jgi:GAF domain-containing protein